MYLLQTGKEPEVKRILDAQERTFHQQRKALGARHYQLITDNPLEAGVTLHGPGGKKYHWTQVTQHYIVADKSVKDVLMELAYYHDKMGQVQKGNKVKFCSPTPKTIDYLMQQCVLSPQVVRQPLLVNMHIGGETFQFLIRDAEQGGGRQVCVKSEKKSPCNFSMPI